MHLLVINSDVSPLSLLPVIIYSNRLMVITSLLVFVALFAWFGDDALQSMRVSELTSDRGALMYDAQTILTQSTMDVTTLSSCVSQISHLVTACAQACGKNSRLRHVNLVSPNSPPTCSRASENTRVQSS